MYVIAVGNQKGGTGKTTTAMVLAMTLADPERGPGLRVAVLDADPSEHVTRWAEARAGQGRAPVFQLVAHPDYDRREGLTSVFTDMVDDFIDGGTADILIIDLEGTGNDIFGKAVSRSNLLIIPMKASSMDARLAAKASAVAKRVAREFRTTVDYVFTLSATNAAIQTRERKLIEAELERAGEPLLPASLNERSAFQAVFTYAKTLLELDESEARGVDKAIDNAVAFAGAVTQHIDRTSQEKAA